jgi:hypothetical protein
LASRLESHGRLLRPNRHTKNETDNAKGRIRHDNQQQAGKNISSGNRRIRCLAMLVATPLAVTAGHAAEKKPPFVIGVSNDSVANPFRVQMGHVEIYTTSFGFYQAPVGQDVGSKRYVRFR